MWSAERAAPSSTRHALALLLLLPLLGCEREQPQELGPPPAATAEPAAAPAVAEPPAPVVASPGAPSRIAADAVEAAGTIAGQDIRRVVAEIADDRYAGRAPGTPGDKSARAYLAKELEALGFEPGVNGSFEQPVELVGVTSTPPAKWRFTRGGANVDLARNTDFIAGSGVQTARAEIANAELVFVGYGIEAPEYGWDDFKGADVAGTVLVMLNNDPDWDPTLFAGTERLYYGRWTYKYESAARHGAAGAIIIHTTPSAGYPWQVVQTSWGGPQFHLPAGDEPHVSVQAWITDVAARKLLGSSGDLDGLIRQASRRDFVPVPLGITTSLTLRNVLTRTR